MEIGDRHNMTTFLPTGLGATNGYFHDTKKLSVHCKQKKKKRKKGWDLQLCQLCLVCGSDVDV